MVTVKRERKKEININIRRLVFHEASRCAASGSVELYFHALLSSALDGGERSASRSDRFVLENQPSVSIGEKVGWTPQSVWKNPTGIPWSSSP
jgi:hypothetical protein